MVSPSLDFTVRIAGKAGEILRAGLGKKLRVEFKSRRNLVTSVDRAAEKLIVAEIRKRFPDHEIIAEESFHKVKRQRLNLKGYRWFIDPLDGTTNFVHGFPFVAVSIGLEFRGAMILGVVYCPFLNELFTAERGHGAYLNGKRIHVSKVNNLEHALLATGFIQKTRAKNIPIFIKMMKHCQEIRRPGSAAIDLCYVAAGRLDGFWEFGLGPWDIAAGSLILKEAGGKATNIDGSKLDLFGKNLIATNGKIHSVVKKNIKP